MPKDKPNNPTGGKDSGTPVDCTSQPCPCVPISSIRILSIKFLSDHTLLKNYSTDYGDGGARFPKPEWTPAAQHPVSHSMGKEVSIEMQVEVLPANACPATGTLKGAGPGGLVFEKKSYNFTPGFHTFTLSTVPGKLPKKVDVLAFQVQWTADVGSVTPASTTNTMYVTYDTPYNDTPYNNGVTEWRMKWVCSLCQGDTNGHASVKKIHDSTGTYDLNAPVAPEHWAIADGASAQCMDLSKFYMLATEMLGLRTGVVVYLYPKAGKTTKETTSGVDNERRAVSSPPHPAGTTHDDLNTQEKVAFKDGSGSGNNFEACYRFTHPDISGNMKTTYYAGGADIYDTAQEVMENVCAETHWVFQVTATTWSICSSPGPSPIEVW